ncbi:uncharacterized protein LOC108203759 isoform X1 [Daucus carota subsp. sativus]|uniref:uncharacterized protein LOC108203759 isoform X1 n=1 Tax=Daucus carota subsp. sativus TaxID=79200 RepID=UPI00308281CD
MVPRKDVAGIVFFTVKIIFFFKLLVAFLKSRLGFVRIAMEKGCDTVPVCGFGQTEINKWWKPNADLILQIGRAIRVAPIIFRGICGNGVDRRASRFSQVYSIQTVYHSDRHDCYIDTNFMERIDVCNW